MEGGSGHVVKFGPMYMKHCGQEKMRRSDLVLWQKTIYQEKIKKKQSDNTKNVTKTSITQRLHTDLGRPVWVTTATQLMLNWIHKLCNQKDTFKNYD